MPNMSKQYQLILGTFIDNEFVWHDVDSFDTLEEAYKEFKKYVNSQLKYTDEELVKVWNTGRLDVELRRGNRLLNWVGIYAREVDKLAKEEEEEADKENPEKKKKTEDSVSKNEEIQIKAQAVEDLLESVFPGGRIDRRGINALENYWHKDIDTAAKQSADEFRKYLLKQDIWDLINAVEFIEDEGQEFFK